MVPDAKRQMEKWGPAAGTPAVKVLRIYARALADRRRAAGKARTHTHTTTPARCTHAVKMKARGTAYPPFAEMRRE